MYYNKKVTLTCLIGLYLYQIHYSLKLWRNEPGCSKLMMSLVNVSLKLWCKSYSHFFSKHTCELDIVVTRTVNILTTNELVKITRLWTTGPWSTFMGDNSVKLFCCLLKRVLFLRERNCSSLEQMKKGPLLKQKNCYQWGIIFLFKLEPFTEGRKTFTALCHSSPLDIEIVLIFPNLSIAL